MRLWLCGLIMMAGGCAHYGQWADVGSTAIGLGAGYQEFNPVLAHPVGLALGGLTKLAIPFWADRLEPKSCYFLHQASNGLGWGAAVANVLTLAQITDGGMASLPILGITALVLAPFHADEHWKHCHDPSRLSSLWF